MSGLLGGLVGGVGGLLGGGGNGNNNQGNNNRPAQNAADEPGTGSGVSTTELPASEESEAPGTNNADNPNLQQPAAPGTATNPTPTAAPLIPVIVVGSTPGAQATLSTPTLPDPSLASSFSSTFTSRVTAPPSIIVTVVPPISSERSTLRPLETLSSSTTPPASLQTTASAEASQAGPGAGMPQTTVMALAVTIPLVAVALIGIGFFVCRTRRNKRRRDSMPYDEEFESLKKKHVEKFGPGHNY